MAHGRAIPVFMYKMEPTMSYHDHEMQEGIITRESSQDNDHWVVIEIPMRERLAQALEKHMEETDIDKDDERWLFGPMDNAEFHQVINFTEGWLAAIN
jgi:hypothetical protein